MMRPRTLEDFIGQEHLVGEGSVIHRMAERKTLSSLLLWGPPGVGKTTLARILARVTGADFHQLSAVTAGVGDVKKIIETAISQGETEKERIIEEANRAAQDIKRNAEMAVQHEIAEGKLKLREEVANQAVLIAEELIKKSLQKDDQVRLVEDYLEKVGTIQ